MSPGGGYGALLKDVSSKSLYWTKCSGYCYLMRPGIQLAFGRPHCHFDNQFFCIYVAFSSSSVLGT